MKNAKHASIYMKTLLVQKRIVLNEKTQKTMARTENIHLCSFPVVENESRRKIKTMN